MEGRGGGVVKHIWYTGTNCATDRYRSTARGLGTTVGWDGMGWDGMGWGGVEWSGVGWMGWDGMGWDGMGWDGMGWDGMGWDGMGWDGMGWDGEMGGEGRVLSACIISEVVFLYMVMKTFRLCCKHTSCNVNYHMNHLRHTMSYA